MKVIIIHSGIPGVTADTLAVVDSTENLGHLAFTEIDQEDSTGYMTRNRHIQLSLQRIFNDVLSIFGIRPVAANAEPTIKETFEKAING
jgi:hypothetical protein